jgi:hypothetical protein
MTNETVQTFVVLAERARQAGLIQFAEMPMVLSALQEAEQQLKPPQVPEAPQVENGNPAPDEAGKNKK